MSMMQVTFLGTGTSTGIPQIGCTCPVCTSTDPRDSRLRTSAIVEIEGKNILIDCGPDFRQQMLRFHIKRIDAVLVTHIHYDHTGGIDVLSGKTVLFLFIWSLRSPREYETGCLIVLPIIVIREFPIFVCKR